MCYEKKKSHVTVVIPQERVTMCYRVTGIDVSNGNAMPYRSRMRRRTGSYLKSSYVFQSNIGRTPYRERRSYKGNCTQPRSV